MAAVTLNGQEIILERFTLEKALRVITLLSLLRKEVPEISKEFTRFRREYAQENATYLDRTSAVALYGESLAHLTDADWERSGGKLLQPGVPGQAEVFAELAPLIVERAEGVAMRMLGLLATSNEKLAGWIKSGTWQERVDEYADEMIRPAELNEVIDLIVACADLVDEQVLRKIDEVRDRGETWGGCSDGGGRLRRRRPRRRRASLPSSRVPLHHRLHRPVRMDPRHRPGPRLRRRPPIPQVLL